MLKKVLFLASCVGAFVVTHSVITATAVKNTKLAVEYSPNFPKNQVAKYRILITSNPVAFGERQAAIRIAAAASKLGWEWVLVDRLDKQPELLKQTQPNFVISLREEISPVLGKTPHFLYLHVPMFMLLNKDNSLATKAYPNLLKYDAFLQVVPDATVLAKAYLQVNKKPFYHTKTVFSVMTTAFNETPKQTLCYWGTTWDNRRGGEKYTELYQKLDETGYLRIYGPEWSWKKLKLSGYCGQLPIDNHTLLKHLAEAGIALVLHSGEHLRGEVPTSRIFEAAAASTLIISDDHAFVKKEFGDSVLYIDTNQSAESIFKQIDAHVSWARRNPALALEKARKSHKIFTEKFSLEKELEKIAEVYERLKKN